MPCAWLHKTMGWGDAAFFANPASARLGRRLKALVGSSGRFLYAQCPGSNNRADSPLAMPALRGRVGIWDTGG